MRSLRPLLLLMLLGTAALAAQDVTAPGTATALPPGARYTGYIANWRIKTLEIKLDRMSGRTWAYDRHTDLMVAIPTERLEPDLSSDTPRFQIIGNNETLLLMNTTTGRTWRFDIKPNHGTSGYHAASSVTGKEIEGWHLVR